MSWSDFIRSFLDYISKRDSEILHDTLYNMNFNREKIIKILSRYGIRSVPTRTNASDLVTKAAVSELLPKPLTALNTMKESFGNYFDGLPRQSIEAIYEQYNLSQDKVLDYIDFKEPSDKMEESAFEYLKCYIDECKFLTLQKLLKFVTGSTMILPGKKNSIDAEAMNELEMRPKAQTCINLLTIPKKSPTFHAFQQCFQFYMECGEL